MKELPVEYLRECLAYDPLNGTFTWLVRPEYHFATHRACSVTNARCARKRAGQSDSSNGYHVIGITFRGRHRLYQAHRIAIALTDGQWPLLSIDHINGDKSDNRRSNLRVCSHEQNMRNQGAKSKGNSRLKGAYFNRRVGKWQSSICVAYKQHHLGYFETAQAAHAAYREASSRLHGQFANYG